MIIGIVNANLEATIRLIVRGAQGQEHAIEAVINTGFTGSLTLPAELIAALGLTWHGHAQAELADGNLHLFDVCGHASLG
jgi:predicted aspartyl protease